MPVSDDEYDRMLATSAAAVQHMDDKLRDAMRMLTAAAMSSPGDLVIYSGAMSRADMYDTIIERDDYNDCVRVRVRPKATQSRETKSTPSASTPPAQR